MCKKKKLPSHQDQAPQPPRSEPQNEAAGCRPERAVLTVPSMPAMVGDTDLGSPPETRTFSRWCDVNQSAVEHVPAKGKGDERRALAGAATADGKGALSTAFKRDIFFPEPLPDGGTQKRTCWEEGCQEA